MRPATAEFRRGWSVILAAAIGVGLGVTGLPIYTTGQFILPLQAAYGWSRAEISSGLLCLTIVGVVMAPIIGLLTERFGVRRVAISAMIGLAAGYIGLSFNQGSIVLYDASWAALAFLGAGTSPIVWTRAVASWFDRQRGLALGMTLCGTGIVAMVGPGVIGAIIAARGWQTGFRALGAAQLIVGLPVVLLLFRARERTAEGASSEPSGITLVQAVRGRGFWQIAAAFFLMAIVVGGMIVHLPAMFADRGVPPPQAGAALGLLGISLIGGRLVIGALLDRLPVRLVAPAFILLPVFSCLSLLRGGWIAAAVVLFGLSTGAEVDMLAYLVSRYFGLRHYARIYGWMLSAFSAGVGLGPVFAGWVHDRTAGYTPALYVFIALVTAAAALIAALGRTRPAG